MPDSSYRKLTGDSGRRRGLRSVFQHISCIIEKYETQNHTRQNFIHQQ